MGAFWVRSPLADVLSAGSHGTTFGGSPLACAVALKILDVIQREKLAENARNVGEHLKRGLQSLAQKYPKVLRTVRGLGLMLGLELAADIPNLPGEPGKTQAVRMANLLHGAGLLSIPAGTQILRFLPPLNLRRVEADEALEVIENVVSNLAG
jgi:acetylornithine/succinyldiaminopimelate/putrescine aminotransferase